MVTSHMFPMNVDRWCVHDPCAGSEAERVTNYDRSTGWTRYAESSHGAWAHVATSILESAGGLDADADAPRARCWNSSARDRETHAAYMIDAITTAPATLTTAVPELTMTPCNESTKNVFTEPTRYAYAVASDARFSKAGGMRRTKCTVFIAFLSVNAGFITLHVPSRSDMLWISWYSAGSIPTSPPTCLMHFAMPLAVISPAA